MRNIYAEIIEALKRRENFTIATVVNTKGSTPRKAGAKMLFFPGGRTVGTIGGGCGEAEVWNEAMASMGRTTPKLMTVNLTEDVEAEDRICGGIMEIIIEPLQAGD